MYYVCTNYDVITDASGNVKERLSFDAWGNRRNPNNWAQAEATGTSHIFSRGFTGHEHLDYFGIINMNGRLYDPLIARFFSPDPHVADAENTQDFNRYSYARNNPLMYTDPSGEDPFLITLAISAAFNVFIKVGTGQINSIGDFLTAVGTGALGGAAGYGVGALVGGVLGDIGFIGGVLTAGTTGAAGGFVGSIADTWMSGAGFNAGFKAGFSSAVMGGIIGGLTGGIVGGLKALEGNANFWTGKATFDLSKGYGAHNVPEYIKDKVIKAKYLGKYEGVSIYESLEMGSGKYSGGVSLPGIGIIIGENVYPNGYIELLQHEFGHILQSQIIGEPAYYQIIGPESLASASMHGYWGHNHSMFWTETWANYLSFKYFGSKYIMSSDFPIQNIDSGHASRFLRNPFSVFSILSKLLGF